MSTREKLIYTFGYSGSSLAHLKWLSDRFEATVVDIRYSTRTRRVDLSVQRLEAALKGRYVHIPEFGNLNYKNGGPVELADPKLGIFRISGILSLSSVMLLCVCASWEECHRSYVAQLLSSEFALPVKHLTHDDVV